MESLEIALATYIDINLLLAGTALVWLAARKLFTVTYTVRAFTAQFALLKLLVLAAFLLPSLLKVWSHITGPSQPVPMTLSDLILSQYLQGNLQVSPGLLEQVLSLRQNLTSQLAMPENPLVYGFVIGVLLTAGIMILRSLLTALKLHHILRSAHEWRSFGRLKLLISDTIHVPFSTRTIRHKYVVVPSSMLTRQTDTKVALAHELQHLRDSDVDWEVCVSLLTPLFFWNPAFHFFRRQLEELRELSCDQKVLSRGLLKADEYCACLLRVCADRFHRPRLFQLRIPEVALAETRIGFVGNRPARLLANRLLSAVECGMFEQSKTKLTCVAVLLFASVGTLSFTVQKPHDWSQDRLMLSTIVNLERLENRNRIGLASYRSY